MPTIFSNFNGNMNINPRNIDHNASKEEMVQIISKHEVFAGYNPREVEQLNSVVSFCSVKKQEVIFEIDDSPNHIYYLVDGAVTLYFPDNSKLNILRDELIGEIGVLNGDFRLGRLIAGEDSKLIAICTKNLFDPEEISPHLSLEIVKRLSKRVTNYLRSIQNISSKEIILAGENERIEFKSTLRWNLKANRKDDAITHAVLKTLAAFLNTDGGTLMVGVSDDGEILGLEEDRFESDDKLLLFLTNVMKSRFGNLYLENIHYHTEKIEDKTILRVDVIAGNSPCYYQADKLSHFYIRTGPSTTDLKLSEVYDYIKNRFG